LINTENKDKLLRNCQRALTQVTVSIEQNLTETEREDQLSKEEVEGVSPKSHEGSSDNVRLAVEGGQRGRQELGKDKEACAPGEFMVGKKAKAMEASTSHYQELHHQEHSQHIGADNQARALEVEFNSAMRHIDMQNEELKSVRNELAAVKQQLSDTVNLAEVRGKELKGAQIFLTKADALSVTDVVQKVNTLNEEIFRMAAYLGEVLVYEVLEPEAGRLAHRLAVVKSTYKRALGYLGETLANALAQHSVIEPKEESNPLLVQIVMQIALTNWCGILSRRWTSYQKADESASEAEGPPTGSSSKLSISKQADYNRFVSELYDSIHDHGKSHSKPPFHSGSNSSRRGPICGGSLAVTNEGSSPVLYQRMGGPFDGDHLLDYGRRWVGYPFQ
jgi:hypothetical protein